MSELSAYREEIDTIDEQIRKLFLRRMEIVGEVASIKMMNDMTVYDHKREEEVINNNSGKIENDLFKEYYLQVLDSILKVSKEYQKYLIFRSTL